MVRGIQYCMENMSHRFEQNPRRPSASEGVCTYICRLRHLALAGVDAPFFQSGTFDAKSCHVSKRGSPHLRKFLFEVVSMIFLHGSLDNPVYCFIDKERPGGKTFLCVYHSRICEASAAEYNYAYGFMVTINRMDGYSTMYAHMTNFTVSPDQYVEQGQVIGYVGSTGVYTTGLHLHFTIYYNGSTVKPMEYIG